jgi:hypothetical protein
MTKDQSDDYINLFCLSRVRLCPQSITPDNHHYIFRCRSINHLDRYFREHEDAMDGFVYRFEKHGKAWVFHSEYKSIYITGCLVLKEG